MKMFLILAAVSAAIYPALPESAAGAQDTSAQVAIELPSFDETAPEPVMVSNPVVQEIPVVEEEDFGAYGASEEEIDCMVSAVYYEARGEPVEGRVAVVEVILARRESDSWPSTACDVIAQRSQFSFVRNGYIPEVKPASYDRAKKVVMDVLSGRSTSSAKGATYFHATYSRPSWRHSMRQISKIGRHLFYVA